MNIAVRPPTEKELALSAHTRRVEFHQRIADKAAELKAAKIRAATAGLGAPVSVQPIAPEAMPAEPDPPVVCPHCLNLLSPFAVDRSARAYPSIAEIQAVVGRYYNVSRADICSSRRTKDVVRPRQVAVYIAKQLTPNSLPAIGRRFGGRDHTTALSSVRKITRLLETEEGLRATIDKLIQELGGRLD